ncbi:N-acetyltransferase [bacterium]|nr:N-acetyltransferase [bacterium]
MAPTSTSPTEVRPVQSAADLDVFIDLPHRTRHRQALWVPPLRRDMKVLLDRKKHPFHKHAEVEYFLAWRDGEAVGRIAAIHNHAHNEFHGENIGFFGFLEGWSEQPIFSALLEAAEGWCRAKGLSAVRGPANFSTNEECGLLVEGFETPPSVMTTWNPPTWVPLIENAGYAKAKDLLSWWLTEDTYDERMHRLAERMKDKLEKSHGTVVCRPLRMKEFAAELERFRVVYNAAWEKNWGFVPMTREEIDFMAAELRPVIVPELVRFVEISGEPVGVSFSLPDYNQILRFMKGKLGVSEIAMALLMKSRLKTIRFITLGVVDKFRSRGLESLLVSETVVACRKLGYCATDMGWILEDNDMMNRILANLGSKVYKRHRFYEKGL